ncbi:MBL fold metallo-hydrolase [Sphingomonas jatrophae]|uniref:L-ascorbate metabolism protein UlaG, beta-lactamase superfamily n=1 Tax=Sphingomonas jatrophae TaxID=1166337 RepID=A0A1I6LMI0_9SPHN|nr:MBL fold metallo-hydrolase [Sphingomonas jatrophae]SFS04696.1 L-ascorbate metabolism protein UlaG, beta-lactamase superfamily [Sphingomonas jatrophae]
MRRAVRIFGTALLFLIVGLCLAAVCVPPFLDRVYYQGPVSAHFDGARFFNPDDAPGRPAARFSPARLIRFLARSGRAPWPEKVAVPRGYPPAEATPCPPMRGAVVENWGRCSAQVDPFAMWVTWIGHATALVQANGVSILTDPIWSERTGPLVFGPKRVREPGIRLDDLPKIDLILISHAHWDHLDLPTLKALWERDKPLIVTGLGNDTILRKAGIPAQAHDWGGRVAVKPGVEVIVERVHHWSTRWGADRNRALWAGFAVRMPAGNLFFAGDTGWGDGSWVREAARHGPYRLALIPIGAFLPREMMQPSHISPVEAADVFRGVGAAHALGIHWGTFQLSDEAIDAPPLLLAQTLRARGVPADRFRTLEVGRPWAVPPLAPAPARR